MGGVAAIADDEPVSGYIRRGAWLRAAGLGEWGCKWGCGLQGGT